MTGRRRWMAYVRGQRFEDMLDNMRMTLTSILAIVTCASAAKVLLIPGPAVSHCLETLAVGKELLKRGHDVTVFAHLFDAKACINRWDLSKFKSKFKTLSPALDPDVIQKHNTFFEQTEKVMMDGTGLLKMLIFMIKPVITNLCHSAFSDQNVLNELQEDKYDLAVVEGLPMTGCIFSIPVYLGIPYAATGSFIDPQDAMMPLQTTLFPSLFLPYSNDMTFPERFINTITYFLNPLIKYAIIHSIDLSSYSEKLKTVDTRNLIKDSVLFLENSDYFIDYPKALFPNFLQVGGLTASPSNPLPEDLRKYIDGARDGVILVTFGSVLKHVPQRVVERMTNAMARLEQRILFKHNNEELKGNIKTMKWIPQNDVLGHPNVKLFVSHCGKNSLWEGIYHAVPIICTPFGTDAVSTGIKVMKYGVGSSVNILQGTTEEIFQTVQAVLGNKTIEQNMKTMSAIMRDRSETPSQRAASAVEHVIKYGGDHMRPPEVDFLSSIYADVWLIIFVFHFLLVSGVIFICRKCWSIRKGFNKPKAD
ncbi:UDP-glucuronosyltransferase 3A1-like isoform X1 [Haliotis rufescens]|uniref:UDP-glucuronosyltransferase 3A1-like isoform X1 n=2 Tax=Haliotis rufescens TaxID=6454 RepID=UPI00201F10F9|nr:UDP-glucuronosyltransferase 3A1-like isoform X1 [Haliotis rufescens]